MYLVWREVVSYSAGTMYDRSLDLSWIGMCFGENIQLCFNLNATDNLFSKSVIKIL